MTKQINDQKSKDSLSRGFKMSENCDREINKFLKRREK